MSFEHKNWDKGKQKSHDEWFKTIKKQRVRAHEILDKVYDFDEKESAFCIMGYFTRDEKVKGKKGGVKMNHDGHIMQYDGFETPGTSDLLASLLNDLEIETRQRYVGFLFNVLIGVGRVEAAEKYMKLSKEELIDWWEMNQKHASKLSKTEK